MAKVETERFFGKKGIIIMIRDGGKMVSAIFKDKKNADKFNRNKPADVKKLLQLAKKTKFPKAIDEAKKYLYKKDALTDYFKGKLSAKELDKIAKDNFGVGIATKKELSSFLTNKFTQDVMSDTYGIPSGTLVKRVRGLMKFAEGIGEDTDVGHQDDEPNMLKSTALEIMEYGKKLMDKLDKYDDMEGEVDFPNWWQSKLTLAKDYLQKAYHYLDSEEKTSENIDRNFRSYDNDEEGDDEGPKDEGFASDAQRRAAFASGYKAKGKKGKKKKNESINECWDTHKQVGFKMKNGKRVPNCVPKNESVNEDDMVFDPKTKSFKIKSGSMDWEKNFKWANDKELKVISKFIFMNPKGISGVIKMSKHKPFAFRRTIQKMAKKGLHEGKKRYNVMYGVGSSKYTVNFHDGKSKHKDGSDFFDIAIFKNKRDLAKKINDLTKKGYIYSYQEGVKENKSQISKIYKQAGKKEIKFYDVLSKLEKKMGKKNYRAFLVKSLKDFKINGNHYDYRTNAAAEEKLFQLAK